MLGRGEEKGAAVRSKKTQDGPKHWVSMEAFRKKIRQG
jgi:hypothetical protein